MNIKEVPLIVGVLFIIADQTAKNSLIKAGLVFEIGNKFVIDGHYNNEILGSFTINNTLILILSAVVITTLIHLYAKSHNRPQRSFWYLAMIIAGGISNFLDRAIHGAVIDIFIGESIQFNMADIAILIGAIMYLILFFTESDNAKE